MAKIQDVWYFIKRLFSSSHPKTMIVKITAYGWHDNDPPGAAIAYPCMNGGKTIHYRAGGVGSFDDPITFAANPGVFPKGTKIFIPRLGKYFIMEDRCGAAMQRTLGEPPIVDIWIGGTSKSDRVKLTKAEWDLTRESETIVVNPANVYTWNPELLFEDK